jgi:transcription antitermination factor NusA-like protein
MRVQELNSKKVEIVEASGNISQIIKELGKLEIHVIQYIEKDPTDPINITKF